MRFICSELPVNLQMGGSYDCIEKRRFLGIVLFSVCIELVQFIIGLLIGYNYRCVDIDDVILNSLGGIIILLVFERIIKRVKKRKSKKQG